MTMTPLEQAEAALAAALAQRERRLAARPPHDPALARLAPTALRQHQRSIAADDAAWRREQAAIDHARHRVDVERRREQQDAERAREKPTAEQLRTAGARFVRTRHGWYGVVRVNRTTVKVLTSPGMDDRIPLAKVLEWR